MQIKESEFRSVRLSKFLPRRLKRKLNKIYGPVSNSITVYYDGVLAKAFPYEQVTVSARGKQFTLTGFRGDHITRFMRRGAFYEGGMLEFLADRYGEGGLYVDVGAYIGTHSVFFAGVCNADKVIAIEPHKETFELLVQNSQRLQNSKIVTLMVGAGEESGQGLMHVSNRRNRGTATVELNATGEVPIVTGDELFEDMEEVVKMIKIDAETMSLPALSGFSATLKRDHPVIVIECQPDAEAEIREYLVDKGYESIGCFNHTPTYIYEWTGKVSGSK